MTEAVRQICAAAFWGLDIIRITGLVYAPNVASQRVLEKTALYGKAYRRVLFIKMGKFMIYFYMRS